MCRVENATRQERSGSFIALLQSVREKAFEGKGTTYLTASYEERLHPNEASSSDQYDPSYFTGGNEMVPYTTPKTTHPTQL